MLKPTPKQKQKDKSQSEVLVLLLQSRKVVFSQEACDKTRSSWTVVSGDESACSALDALRLDSSRSRFWHGYHTTAPLRGEVLYDCYHSMYSAIEINNIIIVIIITL